MVDILLFKDLLYIYTLYTVVYTFEERYCMVFVNICWNIAFPYLIFRLSTPCEMVHGNVSNFKNNRFYSCLMRCQQIPAIEYLPFT